MNTPMSSHTYFLPYFPEISKELGNSHAATIMARMEYWFSKYQDGFYKFLEPCEHPCYRQGDSWSEEIGIARKTFNRAFDLVGARYKSKSDFMKMADPFQGKPYASYHDRKTNRTHFVRNQKVLSEFFQRILSFFTQFLNKPKGLKGNAIEIKGRSRNGTFGHSYGCANKDKQKNTSSSKGVFQGHTSNIKDLDENREEEAMKEVKASFQDNPSVEGAGGETNISPLDAQDSIEEMLKTWEEIIGPLDALDQKPYVRKKIKESFGNNFQEFRAYCLQIASSKFLMGEEKRAKTFKKVQLRWALKPETIEQVRGGAFTLGDRTIPSLQKAYGEEIEHKAKKLLTDICAPLKDAGFARPILEEILKRSSPAEFYGAFKDTDNFEISTDKASGTLLIKPLNSFTYFMIDRFVRARMPRDGLQLKTGDLFRISVEG